LREASTPVLVFDAYGTLFDVHSAVARHRDRIGPHADRLSELWRSKQLEYSFVRTLAGAPFRDFEALTAEALDHALARHGIVAPDLRAELLAAYSRLDPFPEVPGFLAELRRGGARLAILSNGSEAMLARALAASNLDGAFDAVLSADRLRQFKTSPQVYALVPKIFGCLPDDVTFHSSNRWDIAGACLAGFRTVWVNRAGAAEEYPDCPPTRQVRSLAEAVPGAAA
jgi:2-haloacid dehalogenase